VIKVDFLCEGQCDNTAALNSEVVVCIISSFVKKVLKLISQSAQTVVAPYSNYCKV
jgi:hypothetical protein